MKNKTVKNIIKGLLVFLLFWYSGYFQWIPVWLFRLDPDNIGAKTGIILTTFSSVVTLVILLLIYRKDLIEDFKKFKENKQENIDIAFKYWLLGLFLMIAGNLFINIILKGGGPTNEQAVQKMIKSLPYLMVLEAGLLAPIVEEIAFRKTVKAITNNKFLFLLISSLLFGLAHVVNSSTTWVEYAYLVPYAFLGLALALAYHKTDSIWTSIFMHIVHNTVLIILSIATL